MLALAIFWIALCLALFSALFSREGARMIAVVMVACASVIGEVLAEWTGDASPLLPFAFLDFYMVLVFAGLYFYTFPRRRWLLACMFFNVVMVMVSTTAHFVPVSEASYLWTLHACTYGILACIGVPPIWENFRGRASGRQHGHLDFGRFVRSRSLDL